MPHAPRKLVLLVDDDDDVLESLALLLKDDYAVACAKNGAEACVALDGGFQASVIVLDMMMPVMGGLDFLRWKVSSRHAHIPVVVFTASVRAIAPPFADTPSLSKTASVADIVAALEHAMNAS